MHFQPVGINRHHNKAGRSERERFAAYDNLIPACIAAARRMGVPTLSSRHRGQCRPEALLGSVCEIHVIACDYSFIYNTTYLVRPERERD